MARGGAFLKFLLRDAVVEKRYYTGELPPDLLQRLHRLLGGTSRFLAQIQTVLQTMEAAGLARELDAVALPASDDKSLLQEVRDRYCESIFAGRLYGALPADSQRWLARAAVFGVVVPVEGLAAAAGVAVDDVRPALAAWQRSAFVYPVVGKTEGGEGKYPAARANLTRALPIQGNRGDESATCHQLATIDVFEGNYPAARQKTRRSLDIKRQIEDRVGEAAAWHQLATIDLLERKVSAARKKFAKALPIRQQIGHRSGEAATWHQLGTIEIQKRKYPAARRKLGQALMIRQQIGDRGGEAHTWHELGVVASMQAHTERGIHLVALGAAIASALNMAAAKGMLMNPMTAAQELGYGTEQVQTLLAEVGASYEADRGRMLYRQAFGDDLPTAPPDAP
jgi:tetratricopeptide (TPR) repeat protein